MREHGKKKGDVHRLVKHKAPPSDPMTYKGDRASQEKDRDSTAGGEGMNLDFPTSPNQDRYKLASTFRVKALQKRMAK
jgi:hypothetical protein